MILGVPGLPSQWWKAARKSSLSAFSPILYATASANESSLSLPLASSSFSKLKSEFASSGTAWVFATWGVSSFSVLVHHMDVAEDSESKASKSTRASSPFVIFSTRSVGKKNPLEPSHSGFRGKYISGMNPPALPACLVVWGLMTDCLSVLCFCLYSLS